MRRDLELFLVFSLTAMMTFGVLYTALSRAGITGFMVFERETYVSINEEKDVEISKFDFDPLITIGDDAVVEVEIMNKGSVAIEDCNYTVEIYNINNTLLYSYPSHSFSLNPGAFDGREFRHSPQDTGNYIVRLVADIGRRTYRTSKFLSVVEEVDTEPEDTVITRKRIEWVEAPEADIEDPSMDWSVSGPESIAVSQGQSQIFTIDIENDGEGIIENIRLSLQSPDNLTVSYNPKIMFSAVPNSTSSFLVNVSSPEKELGNYSLQYRVSSRELETRWRSTEIEVVPELTLEMLEDRVSELSLLISKARTEARVADDWDLNVTETVENLDKAEVKLQEAEGAIEDEDIGRARERIALAEEKIDEAYQKLFTTRSDVYRIRAPMLKPVYIVLLVSVAIAALMTGIYYHFRKKHMKRPELLRKMEERGH